MSNLQKTYPIPISITEYPEFSDRLTIAMKLRGCTVSHLAEELCLSRTAICGYRSGNRAPDLSTLRRIAFILNVSTDFLLGITEYIYV